MPKNTYNARALITSFTKITQSFNFGHSRMKMHARITWFNNYFLRLRKNGTLSYCQLDLSKDNTKVISCKCNEFQFRLYQI